MHSKVCTRDSVNGNTVVLTVTVKVAETRTCRMATPFFFLSQKVHAKTLNSVGMVPICPKMDVLCIHKKESENRPTKHDLDARSKFACDRGKVPITDRR